MLVRHRLTFLVVVLLVAAGLGAVRIMRIPAVSTVALGVLGLLWVGLGLTAIVALNASAPMNFQIRDGAFTTPPPATAILTAGAFTAMAVALTSQQIYETERGWGTDPFQVAVVVLLIVLAPVQWLGVLGPYGLTLRPDGVHDRQPFGSLFVPWEAGAAAEPTRYGIRLSLTRPDLLVRRGRRPGRGIRTGADRGFAAWAVNVYTARPGSRPSIGTPAGLTSLLGLLPPAE